MSEEKTVTPATPGEAAYRGYFGHCEGKSLISGVMLPEWDEQAEEIKAAWEAAADEVLAYEWDGEAEAQEGGVK